MDALYPPGPAQVPADLTAPTPRYRQHAWIAMGALAAFVLLYFALASWFSYKAYVLIAGAFMGGKHGFMGIVFGIPAAFFALFLWKALFFVRHGGKLDDLEVSPTEQPQLFAFLNRLADEAGAPRPHRVFLSPRVNAAVFYDLSILNLLFPSRKNLEIGLGLVNALSLSEFKAVLAHEFGHFAQRSMAVGRWVYIAQQIAEHIVWRRDQLDRFLRGLSRSDIRVAWIGWLLRLVVWSMRSLLETLFQGVMLAQRALSREMEMQADLVAVSLSGSDALIHALHQAQAADDAWDRTLTFADQELRHGRKVVDLFQLQSRVIDHMRVMLGDPDYARTPRVPATQPERHRVFRPELAHPPRMWMTHPHNHEREDNAKRVYLPADHDARPAWVVFADPDGLRRTVSLRMVSSHPAKEVEIADSLRRLDADYAVESLSPAYRGVYLGRSVVRHTDQVQALYADGAHGEPGGLSALYPPEIAELLAQWRSAGKEIALLERVQRGEFAPPGGIVHHRERELPREQIADALLELRREAAALESRLFAHDARCRAEHRAAALRCGGGWADYLQGLLAVLHYAEHSAAELRDAQRFLAREYQVVTADGNVSRRELKRLLSACTVLYGPLKQAYDAVDGVHLDAGLMGRLKLQTWSEAFERFKLPPATAENIGQWLEAIDGWVNSACNALSHLTQLALELLLESERRVRETVLESRPLEDAPAPSRIDSMYPRLLPGKERPLQQRLGWWDRFQVADGWVPASARLAVASSIVAGVVTLGGSVGHATISIYNGLNLPVTVHVGERGATLSPFASAKLDVELAPFTIRALDGRGHEIERFDAVVDVAYADHVYNVAGAAPLIQWTAVYGNATEVPPRSLGAPRWTTVNVDHVLSEPPESVQTKSGSATRTVVQGFGDWSPTEVAEYIPDAAERTRIAATHIRWDALGSQHLDAWLQQLPAHEARHLLEQRLKDAPNDTALQQKIAALAD